MGELLGLLHQFKLLSHTKPFSLLQGLSDKGLENALKRMFMLGKSYHWVIKGLQVTSELSPATQDRARTVLQLWWETNI